MTDPDETDDDDDPTDDIDPRELEADQRDLLRYVRRLRGSE